MTTIWAGGRRGLMMRAYTGEGKAGNTNLANKLFGKMRQMVKGDAGDLDNKDRELKEPVKDK